MTINDETPPARPAVPEKPQEAVAWETLKVIGDPYADASVPRDITNDAKEVATWRAAGYQVRPLYTQPVALWTCPDCGFGFDAAHTNEPNGGYSCPVCELAALRAAVKRTPPSRGISYE